MQWAAGRVKEEVHMTVHSHAKSGYSVNGNIDKDLLDVLRSLLTACPSHHTCDRFNNKTTQIYINKSDIDAAFKRLHVAIKCALLCTTIVDGLAYMVLTRLRFG
jgi:hypothetical protein